MEEALWWIYIATSVVFFLLIMLVLWIFYLTMETQHAIDELETCVLSVLDDALQILIPMAVLNHISQFDVANFEMNVDVKKTTVVRYAEDVSQPLSEKSQAYSFFGDSDRKNVQRSDDMSMHMRIDRVKSMHSLEIVVKTPVAEPRRNSKSGNASSAKQEEKVVVMVSTAKLKVSEPEVKKNVVNVLDECSTQLSESTGSNTNDGSNTKAKVLVKLYSGPRKAADPDSKTVKTAPMSEMPPN